MARKAFLSRVVGSGTEDDPYRASVASLLEGIASKYDSVIPSKADGTPKLGWCLVMVEADDLTAIAQHVDTDDFFPARALDTKLSDLSVAQRSRISTAVQNRLGFLPDTSPNTTLRDVLRFIVNRLL